MSVFEHPHVMRNEYDDVAVVSPVGEFDISVTDLLRSAFAEALSPQTNKIVIDLSSTTFLDSTALGAIIGAARRASDWG